MLQSITTSLLLDRINPFVNAIVGEYQSGFRRGKLTLDQIFTLRQIMSKFYEFDKELHLIFTDYKQVHAIIIEPQLALMLGSIMLAWCVHHFHADESIISRAVSSLKVNPATLQLGNWLEMNVPKFFGIVIATVMSFMMSKTYGVSLAVASVLVIIVMPSMLVNFYIITSLFSILLTRFKTVVERYIIVAIAAIAYLYFMVDAKMHIATN